MNLLDNVQPNPTVVNTVTDTQVRWRRGVCVGVTEVRHVCVDG